MTEPPLSLVKQPPLSTSIWRKSATLYLLALCAMLGFATMAIILIFLSRPHQDNVPIIATVIGFLGSGVPGLMALIKGSENAQSIQDVHVSINSRMDEFLRQASLLGELQGREAERKTTINPPATPGT